MSPAGCDRDTPPTVLCVGLGSSHGDDQFGWRVADRLQQSVKGWTGVEVRQAGTPIDLLHWIEGIEELYLCDVVASDGPLGAVHRFETERTAGERLAMLPELQRLRVGGSHQVGLPAVLDLAATLGRLPQRLIVYGVSGREFGPGRALSVELESAVSHVAEAIRNEIDARAVSDAVAARSG